MEKNATIVFLEPLRFMEIAQYPVHHTYKISLTVVSLLGLCNRDACKIPPATLTKNNLTAEFSVLMVLYH